jgi:glycosyltransferase involved in cell wall biosynthesis
MEKINWINDMKQWELEEIRNGFPVLAKENRKTILILSDDLRFPSGVGTITRQIVLGTCHFFNWIQIGGAANHPDNGKRINLDKVISEETGVQDPSVEIFAINGYGNSQIVRDMITVHNIDCIFHITDPRFWVFLYQMKGELELKAPIVYLNLWDDCPAPAYNIPYYMSTDMLLCINRQTYNMIKVLLQDKVTDVYEGNFEFTKNEPLTKILLDYNPHGQDDTIFKPLDSTDPLLSKFRTEIFKEKDDQIKFVVFFNSRNIRRKMLIDLILAYRDFCQNSEEIKNSTALLLHTDTRDENGTDLPVVIRDLASDLNIFIYDKKIVPTEMNVLYNIADVTANVASNEGFGLSSLESIMAGTMVINSVTGGLQDQLRFEDNNGEWIKFTEEFPSNHNGRYKKCGEWGIPVFPATRSAMGSIPTPYIFDDRVKWEDVSEKIMEVYNMPVEERDQRGLVGRNWVLSDESRMNIGTMCKYLIRDVAYLLINWQPHRTIELLNVNDELSKPALKNVGILKSEL